ncbi:hypothetical protein GGR34_002841 [Microvirga flocculans]|uniref:Uncharacterized protein n=1 Tax=Microvirga flocculans TaxID=217168 RepID=A0A7W6N973_9HYPH|nr:hypothetical protein [Microvirga flocculans]
MQCRFCRQDVDDPCHDMQQMKQRAASHIERCEQALHAMQGMGPGVPRS